MRLSALILEFSFSCQWSQQIFLYMAASYSLLREGSSISPLMLPRHLHLNLDLDLVLGDLTGPLAHVCYHGLICASYAFHVHDLGRRVPKHRCLSRLHNVIILVSCKFRMGLLEKITVIIFKCLYCSSLQRQQGRCCMLLQVALWGQLPCLTAVLLSSCTLLAALSLFFCTVLLTWCLISSAG